MARIVSAGTLVTPRKNVPSGVNVRPQPNFREDPLYVLPFGERLRTRGPAVKGWIPVISPAGKPGFACASLLEEVDPRDIDFKVRFVDTGSGDAALISVGQTDILVDGGDDPAYLANYIRKHQLVRGPIELLIVTHRGSEHWRGFEPLVREHEILEIWMPDAFTRCESESYQKFSAAVRVRRSCVLSHSQVHVRRGASVNIPLNCTVRDLTVHARNEVVDVRLPFTPEIDFTLLSSASPSIPKDAECDHRSDLSSLVFIATIGPWRFFFASDMIGKNAGEDSKELSARYVEQELITYESREEGLLSADVLKVPHHGEDTSSTPQFIKKVGPRNRQNRLIAIIPAKENASQERVLLRYNKASVFRTNENRGAGNDDVLCSNAYDRTLECTNEASPPRRQPVVAAASPRMTAPAISCDR